MFQSVRKIRKYYSSNFALPKGAVCAVAKFSGGTVILKPFCFQPVKFDYDSQGYEYMRLLGKPEKVVRFCPHSCGTYNIYFNDENSKTIKAITVEVVEGKKDGFVSFRDGYFSTDNNQNYMPIGINTAFPTSYSKSSGSEFGLLQENAYLGLRQYERWIKKLSANGVNLIRIWAGHEYFCPDWEEAKKFRYEQFTKLDKLFEICQKYNVKIKLTLEHFRFIIPSEQKKTSPFHKHLLVGGKYYTADEWLQSEDCRLAWLAKVEEYARRYAEDPTLFAIEFWNEMNCLGSCDMRLIAEWNRYMAPRVREMFPHTLLLNSLGSLDSEWVLELYRKFPFELFDFVQVHRYLDQGAKYEVCRESPAEALMDALELLDFKSNHIFVAETGAVNDNHSGPFRYYSADDRGIIAVDCVYTPLFAGAIAPGNLWHWDSRYVESKNLYHIFKPLAELLKGVDFKNERFMPLDCSNDEVRCLILVGKTEYLGFIRNKADNWQKIRDNEPVKKVRLSQIRCADLAIKKLSLKKIWKNDTVKASLNGDGNLIISNFMYGVLIYGSLHDN